MTIGFKNPVLNFGPVPSIRDLARQLATECPAKELGCEECRAIRRREKHRRYNHSPKGRDRYRRWRQSETQKWGGLTDRKYSSAWLRKDISQITEVSDDASLVGASPKTKGATSYPDDSRPKVNGLPGESTSRTARSPWEKKGPRRSEADRPSEERLTQS